MGLRDPGILAGVWDGAVPDHEAVRHGENREGPGALPELAGHLHRAALPHKKHAEKRPRRKAKPEPDPDFASAVRLPE